MTLDLDELERVAKAATPGPWFEANVTVPVMLIGGPARGYVASIRIEQIGGGAIAKAMEEERHANAAHIATFNPVTVLALLARARDAERLKAVMRSVHETLSQSSDDLADDARLTIEFALMVPEALSALNEGGPANG